MNLPPTLETERLRVRRFHPGDFDRFRSFMKDKESTQWLLFEDQQTAEEGIRLLFDWTIESYETEDPVISLAVALRDSDLWIGSVGIARDFSGEGWQMYWSTLRSECGKGYATEAATALLYWALALPGIDAMLAYSHPENVASRRVAEKIGMAETADSPTEVLGMPSLKFEKRSAEPV